MFALFLVVVILIICTLVIRHNRYYTDRNLSHRNVAILDSLSLLGAGMRIMARKNSISQTVFNIYSKYPNERYRGMYMLMIPILMIRDPELIKQIMIKDFSHFTDHHGFYPENTEPLWNDNVFALKGIKWRNMRTTLNKAFTTSKLRSMFVLIDECADQFLKHLIENPLILDSLDMKDCFVRFTNDVTATCAFGISCDSLKNKDNEFYTMGNKISEFSNLGSIFTVFLSLGLPKLVQWLKLPIFNDESKNFFNNIVKETLKEREKSQGTRPDIINTMLEMRNGIKSNLNEDLKDEDIYNNDIVAQAIVSYIASLESVSTLLTFTAIELAVNPHIQDRLLAEVDKLNSRINGKLTYETLADMKYMDMVLNETSRKWPSAAIIERVCVKPYTIEPTSPREVPVYIKKGDTVFFPIFGIHRDPKYYANPEIYDPERFSEDRKHEINPYTYLPFGAGPRYCLGTRFSLIQTKTLLFKILSVFRINPLESTKVPIGISTNKLMISPDGGSELKLTKRFYL